MSYSLHPLQGVVKGTIIRVIQGDTVNLDST